MRYETKKVGHKIVHIPDRELEEALRVKLKWLRECWGWPKSKISTFKHEGGFKGLLGRHARDRFFIIVDFVHAFHQITRQMVAEVFPAIMEKRFDICFVKMAGREVIPIGFRTSNYIFEVYISKRIDAELILWQDAHNGNVTRNSDNILVTWRKQTGAEIDNLKAIFTGLNVRFTPQSPRKWEEPIRFCGLTIPRKGKAHLSKRKARKIMASAREKSSKSFNGALEFVRLWT